MKNTPRINFFGSSQFSIYVLDELEKAKLLPHIIVTTPDKPVGRSLAMTPNPVKKWAISRGITVLSFAKLDAGAVHEIVATGCDIFIVASYGKIIPQAILDIPKFKTLNVHPSLLPAYRGASPLQSAMLDDVKDSGVSIIRVDAIMDHGPIIAQKVVCLSDHLTPAEWPPYEKYEELMGHEGGKLLADMIAPWIDGTLPEREQDHPAATFTKKITKEAGEIRESINTLPHDQQYEIFRKIQAYHQWPTAYFFIEKYGGAGTGTSTSTSTNKKIRVKVTRASFKDEKLVIERVIPEGKKETDFKTFLLSI